MPRSKQHRDKWEHIAVEPETKKRYVKQAKKRNLHLYEVAKEAIELLEKEGEGGNNERY